MIILGIHDGHNCGASIFRNGKLLIAVSEERITRKKNEYGFPNKSIDLCLKRSNIKKKKFLMWLFLQKTCPLSIFR